jgi:hypothetical protein
MSLAQVSALGPLAIDDLRPTQQSLGLREVQLKREKWLSRTQPEREESLQRQTVPVVAAPGGEFYLLDGHHLVRMLWEEGVPRVPVRMMADLSALPLADFWLELRARGWLQSGYGTAPLPRHISDLTDDPFRSLAGELRRRGGFQKDHTPFSEFSWGDYLRRHIDADELAQDFEWAVARALELAALPEASFLPGWCGPAVA